MAGRNAPGVSGTSNLNFPPLPPHFVPQTMVFLHQTFFHLEIPEGLVGCFEEAQTFPSQELFPL